MAVIAALGIPPWAVLSVVIGVASAALFHLVLSTRLRSLPLYVLVGGMAALLGGLLGAQLGPTPWSVGEAHLLAICGASWSALALTRLLGL
jgi:uncharacterized membrane protein YjjB (DUF3815 family)